jgi:ATP-dependent RNA helicase SUPV3L1/SUV3
MDQHENQLGEIFSQLIDRGKLGDAWLEARVARLERVDGDIETLMQRMASVRTWTYVTNHDRWLENPLAWQERSSAIEDRLSDALHEALVARFIDTRRRSSHERVGSGKPSDAGHPFSVLAKLKADLLAPDPADQAHFSSALAEAQHTDFFVSERGRVAFAGVPVAQFCRGRVLTEPEVSLLPLDLAPGAVGRVRRRLLAFAKDFVSDTLGELAHEPETATPALRGLLYQLRQGLGTLPRASAHALLEALTEADNRLLSELGVVLGQQLLFAGELMSLNHLRQRHVLVTAYYERHAPRMPSGVLAEATSTGTPLPCYLALGYGVIGSFAIRADVLESLLHAARERPPVSSHAIGRRCRVGTDQAKQIARVLQRGSGRRRRNRRRRRAPSGDPKVT